MIDVEGMIKEIVGDDYEFWKRDGHDALHNSIVTLLDLDVPPAVITSVLANAWYAGGAEYGGG